MEIYVSITMYNYLYGRWGWMKNTFSVKEKKSAVSVFEYAVLGIFIALLAAKVNIYQP